MTKAEMLIFPFMQHTDHTMKSLSLLSYFCEIYLDDFWPHKHYIQTLIQITIYNPDFFFFKQPQQHLTHQRIVTFYGLKTVNRCTSTPLSFQIITAMFPVFHQAQTK